MSLNSRLIALQGFTSANLKSLLRALQGFLSVTTTTGTDSIWFGFRYSASGALYVTYDKNATDCYLGGKRVSTTGQLVLESVAGPIGYNAGHIFNTTDNTLVAFVDVAPPAQVSFINGLLESDVGAYLTTTEPT